MNQVLTMNVEISERYFFEFDSTSLLRSQLVGIEQTFSFKCIPMLCRLILTHSKQFEIEFSWFLKCSFQMKTWCGKNFLMAAFLTKKVYFKFEFEIEILNIYLKIDKVKSYNNKF